MPSPSRPFPASALRRAALAVSALGLATACGSGSVPGVAVTNAQSDVAFGGNTAPTPAATGAPTTTSGGIPVGPIGFPGQTGPPPLGFDRQPPISFPSQSPPPVRSSLCPGPPPFATAANPATTFVQDQPKVGFYFWQVIKAEEKAPKVVITTPKYTNYEIRNVSAITTSPNPQGDPTTTFTFDQVAPIAGGHVVTYTYQVKQNAPGTNAGEGLPVGKPQRVSVPDAGIAIKAEVERDAAGKVVRQFHPTTAVLVLPLPIQGGATFNGAGSDPSNGASLQVQGTVVGPDRVSGCNDYIQGIRVNATVTSNGVPGQAAASVTQAFTFQTQAGGLLVGNAQNPANTKTTFSSIVGDRLPTKTAKAIPKDERL